MSSAKLTVLWSASAGAQTQELRITRGAATLSLVAVSAVIGACMWIGWEIGHWSAKDTSLAANAASAAVLVAEQTVTQASAESDVAR